MKFLHTADWQIGKPFARIEDADKAAKVRDARIEVIRRIGEVARENDAAFVLVAGDVFDSFTAEKSAVSAACSAIGEIGLPVLAIPGNHDHGGPGCLWQQDFFRQESGHLAPNLRVLLEPEPVELDEAVVLPCPLLHRHESADPTAWIRDLDFSAGEWGKKPRIVLAHGSVHGFDGGGAEEEDDALGTPNLIALDRLPGGELDYVALGDWHGTKQVSSSAWYAGTPEIDRFPKGDDNEPGNVLVVEAERGDTPGVEKIETGRLGWHVVDFGFASDDDLERLEEILAERIGNRTQRDLLHLTLRGSLGIAAANRLEGLLDTWCSRLLRIKEHNEIRIAPSAEEVEALVDRADDPLISRVAAGLVETAGGADEEAGIARIALRELHAACSDA